LTDSPLQAGKGDFVNNSNVISASGTPILPEADPHREETCVKLAAADSTPSTAQSTILVVDDEPTLRETISYTLRREGFLVETAAEGSRAVAIARERNPDLIVLDIMLPGMDGFQVCRAIRRESTVPILMLSAKGEEFDRVLGLEIGADDYLTKPFAMRELVARIKAQLRRVQLDASREAPVIPDQSAIEIGDLRIDVGARQVKVSDHVLSLKPREFDLLHYLATHPNQVFGRAQLLREVWGYDVPFTTRTVDVHVRWLRQKLAEFAGRVPEIETVRGVGYKLIAAAQTANRASS
jgi:DNA-binding response OmpR family regulator